MTEHADHRFSATLSSPDLALIGCLQALAKFSQETGNNIIPCEGTEERDWRAAGQSFEGNLGANAGNIAEGNGDPSGH